MLLVSLEKLQRQNCPKTYGPRFHEAAFDLDTSWYFNYIAEIEEATPIPVETLT